MTMALGASLGLAQGAFAQQAPAGPPTPAAPAGDWRGGAVADPNGQFGYCVTENRFDNNLALVVARNANGETNLAVGIPGAGMKPGERFALKVRIDDSIQREFAGLAAEPDLLVIPTGKDDALYEGLRRGSRLFIEGPTDSTAFQLRGTSKALGDLRDCVQKAVAAGGKVTPGGANGGPQTVAVTLPDTLRALLVAAGLRDIQPLSLANLPEDQRPADYAWRLGPIFGGVREAMVPPDAGFDTLTGNYLDALKQRCPGEFMADPKGIEKLPKASVRTATITCAAQEGKINVAILFYLTDQQVFTVFFHEAADADRETAIKARDNLAQVVRQLASDTTTPAAPAAPRSGG